MTLLRMLRCERGVAAVEFSIVSVVFFMLLIGGIDMGRTLYVKNQLSFLAEQAMREVLLDNSITDQSLTSLIESQFTAGDPDLINITVTSDSIAGTEFRVIQIDFPMTLFIPNLSSSSLNLNIDRRIPIQ